MNILSHVSIGSTKEQMKEMIEFYDIIMDNIGAKRHIVVGQNGVKADGAAAAQQIVASNDMVAVGYGKYFPEFWVSLPFNEQQQKPGNGVHIAFNCTSADHVKKVYDEAIKLGAKDDGPPGPRPQYSDKYYAAYFIDPCGNKMEVMYYDLGMMGYCDIL